MLSGYCSDEEMTNRKESHSCLLAIKLHDYFVITLFFYSGVKYAKWQINRTGLKWAQTAACSTWTELKSAVAKVFHLIAMRCRQLCCGCVLFGLEVARTKTSVAFQSRLDNMTTLPHTHLQAHNSLRGDSNCRTPCLQSAAWIMLNHTVATVFFTCTRSVITLV